jgi:ubiquinone/menaquinone biosynthesis C-methylase UbiE
VLGLPLGARVLDAACGQGRHAHLLAEAGFDVDGLDYSGELLARARARGTGPRLRYTRGDMRAMPEAWSESFDAVLNLSTSFGFFRSPADDAAAVAAFARVLKPGGVFLWHGASRDGVVAGFLARDWWVTAEGTLVAQERSFEPLAGVMTVRSSWARPSLTEVRVHQLRLYTATRLAELCAAAGLLVEGAWDGWRDRPLRRTSSEMLIVGRKCGDARAVEHEPELPRRRGRD